MIAGARSGRLEPQESSPRGEHSDHREVAVADPSRHLGPAVLWFVLVVVLGAVALSVDIVRAGYGVKSDEATYAAAALSAAYDGNLSFERRDLERFWGLYKSGPEGIFLKRGKTLRLHRTDRFPYVGVIKRADQNTDRLYFGKALIYPLAAAPFVRILGLNGVLVFHVLLLATIGVCGYLFLSAQSSSLAAAVFTTAFLGAAALPVYGVFFMPEIFNLALVFAGYFFWLYNEVSPTRRLQGWGPQLAAAVLLGCATYSKPLPNAILITPLLALMVWRRRWRHAAAVGAVFLATTAAWFGLNAAVSGEFNYQGGDRKTFYTTFPFDAPGATWDRRGAGVAVTTTGSTAQDVLTSRELPERFARNVKYFLIGRHFGFIPYFFPGFVAIVLWLFSHARRDAWRVLTFLAFVGSTIVLLLVLPFTWSGGGGPPGNRYLLSAYPTLFFLVPPLRSAAPGVLAWIGGALFTVKMLANPFVTAKMTYLTYEKGPARRLPVELTMANDLPVMLDSSRARIPYRNDPTMFLYFLDQNASPPEPPGMWVSGSGRADILVRTVDPIDHLEVSAESPIRTVLTLSIGGPEVSVRLVPGNVARFDVPAVGVRALESYAYLMSARSTEGFTPHLQDANSPDSRNLGALVRFRAIVKPTGS